jgi:hypothetical protein
MVAFVDERGDLLQEASLTAVPRVGEEVELILMPKVDPASLPRDLPKLSGFKALKILLWGGDKEFDKQIDKSLEGVQLPDPKILNGTVLRVKWTPFVPSLENTITAATVVLRLQDDSPRADG